MSGRPKVGWVFRCPHPKFHSIETLFHALEEPLAKTFDLQRLEVPETHASPRCVYRNSRAARAFDGDLVHVTGHVNYAAASSRQPAILNIYDVGSAFGPNPLRNAAVLLLWYWLPALRASRLIVSSSFTQDALAKLVPFARRKIEVIHCPCALPNMPAKPFDRQDLRILHIGTKPNKNLRRTAEALQGIPCTLVIVGALSQQDRAHLASLAVNVENHVDLTDAKMIETYAGADMVSFASTYEGFGLPIVEANAIGRPVIAGNVASMPEIAGDATCLVDPFDVGGIRAGILRVIEDAEYRQKLVDRGFENAKRFRPERIAAQYAAVYRSVLARA